MSDIFFNNRINDLRCPLCAAEFSKQTLDEVRATCCPSCKTSHPPMKISEDTYIALNWQEVRILAIYAQRWVATFNQNNKGNVDAGTIVNRIVGVLSKQMPAGADNLNAMIVEDPNVAEDIKVRKLGVRSPYFRKRPEEGGSYH